MAVLEITPFFFQTEGLGTGSHERLRGKSLLCQSVSLSLSSSPFLVVLFHSIRLPRPSLWMLVYLPLSPPFVSFPFRWLCEVFVLHFEHRLFVPPVKSRLIFTLSKVTPFFFFFCLNGRKTSTYCVFNLSLLPHFLFILPSWKSRPPLGFIVSHVVLIFVFPAWVRYAADSFIWLCTYLHMRSRRHT